jgi:FAD dependent oxidoreductase TIGR03364
MNQRSAIVIGAGIVGLATARALAIKGFRVIVFERNPQATGASVRNFGMVWPVGQPDGILYERARRSANIWKEVCREAHIWHDKVGSVHVATTQLEADAMQSLAESYGYSRSLQWLDADKALKKSEFINPTNLQGALWSPHEMIVEAREAIPAIAALLKEKYKVEIIHTTAITSIHERKVYSGKRHWNADIIFVCSGVDFETLYPELFYKTEITKCKLQMLRLQGLPGNQRLGPALCGGLSLTHYKGFEISPLVAELKEYYQQKIPEYPKWGIHVMACQNPYGEITVGDTHEYGWHHDPFDKSFLNKLVMDYLATFTTLAGQPIVQTWHGIYAKMTNGDTEMVTKVDKQVYVVNGLGGAGMTLSFGLAEELVSSL